jgi:arabinofuranosyltransferase
MGGERAGRGRGARYPYNPHVVAPRRVERTLIAAVGLLFVAWAVAFVHGSSFVCADGVRRYSLFDDAMISMRYAWNLAHGQGLVWNPGERIEGYTNLLMTLFMAVWCSFLDKEAAVLAVQLSGIAFLLATAAFSAKAGARVASPGGAPPRGLNAALFASALAYYPLAYWSLMGMETGLLAMLVSASVLLALRTDAQPRASLPLAATLGLAFLTRPDAAVLIALIFLYRAAGLPRTRAALKPLLIEAAAVGSFVVAVAAFRLVYYGRLTPNTYTLKIAGIPVLDRLANGFAFMEPFLRSTGLLMALLLVLAVLRRDRRRALVVGLLVVATGYSMWAGGDPWPLWRHAAAVMPLVLVLSAIEIRAFVGRIAARVPLRPAGRSAFGAAASVALMAFVIVLVNAGFGDEIRLRVPPYEADSNR